MSEREVVTPEAVREGYLVLSRGCHVEYDTFTTLPRSYRMACDLVEEIYHAMRKELKHAADSEDKRRA